MMNIVKNVKKEKLNLLKEKIDYNQAVLNQVNNHLTVPQKIQYQFNSNEYDIKKQFKNLISIIIQEKAYLSETELDTIMKLSEDEKLFCIEAQIKQLETNQQIDSLEADAFNNQLHLNQNSLFKKKHLSL